VDIWWKFLAFISLSSMEMWSAAWENIEQIVKKENVATQRKSR
jgi:hypothetical protein